VLGSTVAHHNSVGAGRGDVSTISPLLTASLGAELDHLTDQLTLTWAAGADGLELEPSGGELLGGGGCEIHVVSVCVWLVYRVRGSATIPAGAFPTVTLEAAGIVIVGVHQVVVLTVLIEAVGLGVGVAVSEGSGCHG